MSDAISNAGAPSPALPQWCYRIDRKDGARLTMLTWGSQVQTPDQTMDELAVHVAGIQRVRLPSMGDLTLVVWIWQHRWEEHYRSAVPHDAVPHEFPPHTPEPPEPPERHCPQGVACRLDSDLDWCARCDD